MPSKLAPWPIGSSSGASVGPIKASSAFSVDSKLARSASRQLTKTTTGTPASRARSQITNVSACTPSTALTTSTATSATSRARSTSPWKSMNPGVSRIVNLSSPTQTGAIAMPSDIWCLRSSGSLPQRVAVLDLAGRSSPPVATTRASRRDVFPEPLRPIRATVRALGWLREGTMGPRFDCAYVGNQDIAIEENASNPRLGSYGRSTREPCWRCGRNVKCVFEMRGKKHERSNFILAIAPRPGYDSTEGFGQTLRRHPDE